jgi:transcriptional regulator with XRE-family HTH domain
LTIKHHLFDQEIQQLSKEVGEKIRQERKLAGLTLVDTARASPINQWGLRCLVLLFILNSRRWVKNYLNSFLV